MHPDNELVENNHDKRRVRLDRRSTYNAGMALRGNLFKYFVVSRMRSDRRDEVKSLTSLTSRVTDYRLCV